MSLATIPEALDALRAGRPIIVVDNESRENEGDVVLAAEFASQEWLAWLVRNSSGFVCAPMTNEIADRLELPVMVANNEDSRGTNYTVSVDAADRLSTGISAADRAHTLRYLPMRENLWAEAGGRFGFRRWAHPREPGRRSRFPMSRSLLRTARPSRRHHSGNTVLLLR